MTLAIHPRDFRVPEGKRVDLEKWPTRVKRAYASKKQYRKLIDGHVDELASMQRLHYASNGYAVLVILQGTDAAGKDGAIRHVISGVNPQGCQVFSFKQPSAEEQVRGLGGHEEQWIVVYREDGDASRAR